MYIFIRFKRRERNQKVIRLSVILETDRPALYPPPLARCEEGGALQRRGLRPNVGDWGPRLNRSCMFFFFFPFHSLLHPLLSAYPNSYPFTHFYPFHYFTIVLYGLWYLTFICFNRYPSITLPRTLPPFQNAVVFWMVICLYKSDFVYPALYLFAVLGFVHLSPFAFS